MKKTEEAFEDCINSQKATLEEAMTPCMKMKPEDYIIEDGVLTKYVGKEKQVTIPSNVTIIGENAFAEAYQVEVIIIPDDVKEIAIRAMGNNDNCSSAFERTIKLQLKKLVIGNGVTKIGEGAFAHCSKLKEVVFGNNLKEVGKEAFLGCYELQRIDLSNTAITNIQEKAFSMFVSSHNVQGLYLSPKVETIGERAFSGIILDVVRLPKTVKRVERSAFYGTSELIVYDTIDPYAVEASKWTADKWNGSINSPLSCAMLKVWEGYIECQGNTDWCDYHITVLDAETDHIKYRIFCDSKEGEQYRAMIFSAFGKHASFTFEKYDAYFMKIRTILGKTEMAFCRIQYPMGLVEKYRFYYESYLERCMYIEQSAKCIAEMIADMDAVDRLEILDKYKAIDEHNLAWISKIMEQKHAKRCLNYLSQNFSVRSGM